jgi:hypothetical protein
LVERTVIHVLPIAKHRLCRIRIKRFTRRLFDTDVPDSDTQRAEAGVELKTCRKVSLFCIGSLARIS